MSTCAVMLVRDEADMIEVTVSHLLSQVDEVIVTDHRSVDGTREILERLPVILHRDDQLAAEQRKKITAMAKEALRRGHRWVVPCDGDEIWLGPERIADCLAGVGEKWMVATGAIYNHVPTENDPDDANPVFRLRYRRTQPKGKHKVARKVACRLRPDLKKISFGNHSAHYKEEKHPPAVAMFQIRHFQFRSPEQTIRKVRNFHSGWLRERDYYNHLNDEQVLEKFWYPLLAEEDLVYDPIYSAAQWSAFMPTP
jgi:glycosyltransferase involved in cell wall biosynthesis